MKRLKRIRPEVFILILLIICITYVIHFDQQNGRNGAALVIDENQQVTIVHVRSEITQHASNGRDVLQYKPDACQLAQIYDSDLNLVFSLSFTNDNSIYKYMDSDKMLARLYKANTSGSTKITINGTKHVVDYMWDDVAGTKYLIVYVSSESHASILNSFIVACYLMLILALTLFINTMYWNSRDVTRRYEAIQREINSDMT